MQSSRLIEFSDWAANNGLGTLSSANRVSVPSEARDRTLPPVKTAGELLEEMPAEPPELVKGLIHKGTKTLLVGGSKANKTWCLMALAVAVSAGKPWWGFPTTAGPVFYVNFEVHEAFFTLRLDRVVKALGTGVPSALSIWNLRGHACSAERIIPEIIKCTKKLKPALVVVDPIYKLMGGRDENSAGDIADLLNELERIAVETEAAVAFGAHFSKGNQAAKAAMDRVSGSGVFARDPDTILPLTPHEEAEAFTVEPVLRNFAPVKPFVLRWQHPLMLRADDLDPADLKRPVRTARGAKKVPTLQDYLTLFPASYTTDPKEAIRSSEYISAAFQERGWDQRSIVKLREQACEAGLLIVRRGAHNRLSMAQPQIMKADRECLHMVSQPSP